MTDHIKAARQVWGESAILPLADLERFYAIAFQQGMERAAEICEEPYEFTTQEATLLAQAIRAEASKS